MKPYIYYTEYIMLPSLNLWKLESIVKLKNINSLLSNETLLIAFHFSEEETMLWYDKDLFKFFYSDKLCSEMILLIKNSHVMEPLTQENHG